MSIALLLMDVFVFVKMYNKIKFQDGADKIFDDILGQSSGQGDQTFQAVPGKIIPSRLFQLK